jgi:ATP-dependent Clp protease ATP-binding subunit ClpX
MLSETASVTAASSGESATCSFCDEAPPKVRQVAKGAKVAICNECLDLCNEILEDGECPHDRPDD